MKDTVVKYKKYKFVKHKIFLALYSLLRHDCFTTIAQYWYLTASLLILCAVSLLVSTLAHKDSTSPA